MNEHYDAGASTYGAMPAGDAISDAEISAMIQRGELMPSDDEPFRGPEEWHATGWDADREEG